MACGEHLTLPSCCADGETEAQKSPRCHDKTVTEPRPEPGSRGQRRHVPLPPDPSPSAVWPSAHAYSSAQSSLFDLSRLGKLLPGLQTHAELSHTHTSPAPGAGWVPQGQLGPDASARVASSAAVKPGSWQQPGMIHGGVERQEGLGVALYHKPESHAKVPGIRTGRFDPDLPLSSGLGPRGSPSTPLGEIREAQTPESAVRTTGQVLHLASAPID